MNQKTAIEAFLGARRVGIAKFMEHRFLLEENKKTGLFMGVKSLYEVRQAEGKCPTIQVWLPKDVKSVEDAQKRHPVSLKEGSLVVFEYKDIESGEKYTAANGTLISAAFVEALV